MPENKTDMEPAEELPQFTEKATDKSEPLSCVDGRPDENSPQGAQAPGASLFFPTINAIINNENLDSAAIESGLRKLKEADYAIGAHRGHHKDAGQDKSDCGFADRLPEIINTAKNNRAEILEKLTKIYIAEGIDISTLSSSYDLISNYDTSKIKIKGEPLIAIAEKNEAAIENLQGNHNEEVAFVNLKRGTTLDRSKLNKQGKQAFNFDLWAAVDQGEAAIKAKSETLRDTMLIMYMATERTLRQGKPALRATIHK
jgi:hypothetical protein